MGQDGHEGVDGRIERQVLRERQADEAQQARRQRQESLAVDGFRGQAEGDRAPAHEDQRLVHVRHRGASGDGPAGPDADGLTDEARADERQSRRVGPRSLREAQEQDHEKAREIELPGLAEGVEVLVEELPRERRLRRVGRGFHVSQRDRQAAGFPAKGLRIPRGVGGGEPSEALGHGQARRISGLAKLLSETSSRRSGRRSG